MTFSADKKMTHRRATQAPCDSDRRYTQWYLILENQRKSWDEERATKMQEMTEMALAVSRWTYIERFEFEIVRGERMVVSVAGESFRHRLVVPARTQTRREDGRLILTIAAAAAASAHH